MCEETKTAILDKWLSYIPESLQEINRQYVFESDRVRNLLGKLLLCEGLSSLGYPVTLLEKLKFNEFRKPYICPEFDFNISHSGLYVVCAIAVNRRIGIDIEEIKKVDFLEFSGVMTDSEWSHIFESPNPFVQFFRLWSLKEAVIKAEGVGFMTDQYQNMFIDKNPIQVGDNNWYSKELFFDNDYSSFLVTSEPDDGFEMIYKTFV